MISSTTFTGCWVWAAVSPIVATMLLALPVEFESITATDKSTVVFKLKELNVGVLHAILDGTPYFIYPPEVIKEHGDVTDWRNVVGIGPYELTDWTSGSSITWDKNPDYWCYDEKYPENRLPYLDRIRVLFMPGVATYLAAIRSGKVDYIGSVGISTISTLDHVESLQRTNPELVIQPFHGRSNNGFGMNIQMKPFDDIRVRIAMQKAINFDEINNAYWRGNADVIPQGQINRDFTAIVTPFEEWPEEIKERYTYDPEAAEALLDEAGYPRGADGLLGCHHADDAHLDAGGAPAGLYPHRLVQGAQGADRDYPAHPQKCPHPGGHAFSWAYWPRCGRPASLRPAVTDPGRGRVDHGEHLQPAGDRASPGECPQ